MDWVFLSLKWYGFLFFLSIIFSPLTKKIFSRLSFDFGYPFAKTLTIILISYTVFVLGTMKLIPFTRINLLIIIVFFIVINLFLIIKSPKFLNFSFSQFFIFLFEEILFLSSFLFWTFIRGQEPSIRSLEKFMDFGFINSILRSQFFPPADIWYAGSSINYYYFGHLTGATLIKLTDVKPAIGYNLLLSTIFALGVTSVFSIVVNIIRTTAKKISLIKIIFFGLIGAFIVNLGGNLHTIYLFTTGYPNENPIPFWKIFGGFHPEKYWYPNATRFIPYTIHEFPSYSYVVADLHGHVFDIPFVLLTLAVLFTIFIFKNQKSKINPPAGGQKFISKIKNIFINKLPITNNQYLITIFLGFLTAIHYMTNAFDGPIYLLLTTVIFFIIFRLSYHFIINSILLISSFLVFSLPFSFHFHPFVSGIGINCGSEIFSYAGKIGPFLFEKGNCQISPLWMLFILWGFFWVNFLMFFFTVKSKKSIPNIDSRISNFIFILFSFGTFLILIPEFFYIKDIYPAHFRANTMFKLGYQAFIMMGVASAYSFFLIRQLKKRLFFIFYFLFFILIFLYPFFSIPSYYGQLNRKVILDGSDWLNYFYPEDKEIIGYLNTNENEQPVILEAQGDSYTDYERISAFTGLPTVAGWWVHEWLWRGSPNLISERIPDIITIYQSPDIEKTKNLIKKYKIKYVIISQLERKKYPQIFEDKFNVIGKLVLRSTNGFGALYQVD